MYRATQPERTKYEFSHNAAWVGAQAMLIGRFSQSRSLTVLDIGCHTGDFLGQLPPNWERFGVESAVEPRRIAAAQHGVQMIAERIQDVESGWRCKFDVITLFDVLEHLTDPRSCLLKIRELMKPGGILVLSTADLDAWTWRWLANGHWYLETPRHLCVASRGYIERISSESGLLMRDFVRVPHRKAPSFARVMEAVSCFYWGLRLRKGLYRVPHRLLQSIPGLRKLRHLRSVPWTMSLSDHMLVVLQDPSPASDMK